MKTLEAKKRLLQDILTSASGWKSHANSVSGCTIESKSYPSCSVPCFRVQGVIRASPRTCADFCWNMSDEDSLRIDKSTRERAVVEQVMADVRCLTATTKLPWPLWDRLTLTANVRESRPDGSIWIFNWSVDHPKALPDLKKVVVVNIVLGAYGFVPTASGDATAYRIILADPAGNIPAWIVEASTGDFPRYLTDWRQRLEGKKKEGEAADEKTR